MKRTKYPRTMNVPWSGSNSSDDVWWKDTAPFAGKQVVITEKMDGEATTIYPDGHSHARSVDSLHHPSRSWVRKLAGEICHNIPDGWRICGENLFAFHSIWYTQLPSYFLVYGIYDDNNVCLAWEDTEEYCEILGLKTVPVLYKGPWDGFEHQKFWTGKGTGPTFAGSESHWVETDAEGYVVRLAEAFSYADFERSVAKYVRENHVQTSTHWMTQKLVQNVLL